MLVGRLAMFFFQAEDGIRDLTVTGVQTCALPISAPLDMLRAVQADKPSQRVDRRQPLVPGGHRDRKSTRLNSSHSQISYAVFCLKKKKNTDLIAHGVARLGESQHFDMLRGTFIGT